MGKEEMLPLPPMPLGLADFVPAPGHLTLALDAERARYRVLAVPAAEEELECVRFGVVCHAEMMVVGRATSAAMLPKRSNGHHLVPPCDA